MTPHVGRPSAHQLAEVRRTVDRISLPLGIDELMVEERLVDIVVVAQTPLGHRASSPIRPSAFLCQLPLLREATQAAAQRAIEATLELMDM